MRLDLKHDGGCARLEQDFVPLAGVLQVRQWWVQNLRLGRKGREKREVGAAIWPLETPAA